MRSPRPVQTASVCPLDGLLKVNEYSFIMAKVSETHKAGQRRRILMAAVACFARDGVRGATMQDVAREAGLSAGTLYLYFRSKDDLVAALARAGETQSEAWTQATGASGVEQVVHLLRLAGAAQDPTSSRLSVRLWAEAIGDAELGALYRRSRSNWLDRIGGALSDAPLPKGVSVDALAQVIVAAMAGFELQRAIAPQTDLKPAVEALAALLRIAAGSDAPDPDAPVLVG